MDIANLLNHATESEDRGKKRRSPGGHGTMDMTHILTPSSHNTPGVDHDTMANSAISLLFQRRSMSLHQSTDHKQQPHAHTKPQGGMIANCVADQCTEIFNVSNSLSQQHSQTQHFPGAVRSYPSFPILGLSFLSSEPTGTSILSRSTAHCFPNSSPSPPHNTRILLSSVPPNSMGNDELPSNSSRWRTHNVSIVKAASSSESSPNFPPTTTPPPTKQTTHNKNKKKVIACTSSICSGESRISNKQQHISPFSPSTSSTEHTNHNHNHNNNNQGNNQGNNKPFYCPVTGCHKVFSQFNHLKAHQRLHSGEKPFQCDVPGCEKSFSQAGHLTTHKRVHTGEKPYICDYPGCHKRFSQSTNLNVHLRTHDSRISKPHECRVEGCHKRFSARSRLKIHLSRFHGISPDTIDLRAWTRTDEELVKMAGSGDRTCVPATTSSSTSTNCTIATSTSSGNHQHQHHNDKTKLHAPVKFLQDHSDDTDDDDDHDDGE